MTGVVFDRVSCGNCRLVDIMEARIYPVEPSHEQNVPAARECQRHSDIHAYFDTARWADIWQNKVDKKCTL